MLRATFYLIGEHKSAMEDWQKIKILVGKTGKLGLKRRLGQHKLEQVEKELAEFAITDLLRTVLECCNQFNIDRGLTLLHSSLTIHMFMDYFFFSSFFF